MYTSDTIEFQSRVGPDGMLTLQVPLGQAEAGTDVVVTIRPVVPVKKEGSPTDCVERHPQGEFESREAIE